MWYFNVYFNLFHDDIYIYNLYINFSFKHLPNAILCIYMYVYVVCVCGVCVCMYVCIYIYIYIYTYILILYLLNTKFIILLYIQFLFTIIIF